jgi:acetolactate synthase-1/2/3 large subunit
MAAATGALADAPGVVVVADPGAVAPGAACAAASASALVAVTPPGHAPSLDPSLKATAAVEPGAAGVRAADAVRLALAEPRGPVRLTVPPGALELDGAPAAPDPRRVPPAPDPRALDEAARLLGGAARPVIVTGRRCRFGRVAEWLRPFAETLPAPVLTTLGGKGTLPDPHPLSLGLLDAGPVQRALLDRADLVVALGLDAAELARAPWPAALPVLDLGAATGPEERSGGAVAVAGDAAVVLADLAPRLRVMRRADWNLEELAGLKRLGETPPADDALSAAAVVRALRGMTPAGAVLAVDAGPHLAAARAWAATAPGQFLAPSCGAVPAFAIHAAVAAKLAVPGRPALALAHLEAPHARAALATAVRLGCCVVVLALAGDVAEGVPPAGVLRLPVREPGVLRPALAAALAARGVSVVEIAGAGRGSAGWTV